MFEPFGIFFSLGIYFTIWWITLFAVLPFGVRAQNQSELSKGSDPGAPVAPLMLKKALATTVISAILFIGLLVFARRYG